MSKNKISYFSFLPGWNSGRSVRIAWIFFLVTIGFAIAGTLIANEKPYLCRLDGITYYPLFSGITEAELSLLHPASSPVDWRSTAFQSIWRAPVPYNYSSIDLQTGSNLSPFSVQAVGLRFRHWLGTDTLGHDVLAGMIRGCRVSLFIGLGAMLLALLIGVPLGSIAAYWGNGLWRMTWFQLMVWSISIFFLLCVICLRLTLVTKWITCFSLIGLASIIQYGTHKVKFKKIALPLDRMVMSLISIVDSFPGLFMIVILLVILPVKGWITVMVVIALLRWPGIARYMRSEVFKIKESNYIKAAQILNIPDMNILIRQIIPYAFRPVMITFVFGVSSAILAESSLSFLGIGLPAEEMNWGRLLSQSRNHFDDWWLVLFPGCAIFFTLLSLYTIGNAWQKSMEHRA